ncbi:MAG: methyl-accepting chemotaxis protein, partial [Deltaproteobacteria bacterium]|nr:methyl-accepting chemotaxis protein [Deltaproteobacteria bacterium]
MSRSLRQDRPSNRPPAQGKDTPPHLVALRGRSPDRELRAPSPASARGVSLQTKLLVSYVILGVFLLFATTLVKERLLPGRPFIADAVLVLLTLLAGYALSTAVLRVSRLARLRFSAVEISAGDLSKSVLSEERRGFHDEVDDLTGSIRTMQENLRDLVSRIQRTAQSVAESANELQTSAEEVNASTDEVASSMAKISQGAEEQSSLVERTSKVIGDIAASIERTARSAEEAAKASADTSSGATQSGEAARLAAEKVKKVFARIEAASEQVFAFGERTREITQIVEVITSISQRTNLLALNATIEA